MASIYEVAVDVDNPNSAHAFLLDMVGFNKHVLEVGCAVGSVTKVMVERGCTVVGIEIDPDAAERASTWAETVVVGDLDSPRVWSELEGSQFDVITFGDVLEHLRDPLTTLKAAVRLLKPSGFVVISIPNVAHGDVRIALLRGTFPYQMTGLLDRTHLRFFTKETLYEMLAEAGLLLVETRRVVMPLFQTELAVERSSVAVSTVGEILEDPEAETYQFVVKAVLDDGSHELATLAQRVTELDEQRHGEVVRTALLHKEMEELRAALAQAQLDAAVSQQQLDSILQTKTFRMLSPWRRLYGVLRQGHGAAPPGSS